MTVGAWTIDGSRRGEQSVRCLSVFASAVSHSSLRKVWLGIGRHRSLGLGALEMGESEIPTSVCGRGESCLSESQKSFMSWDWFGLIWIWIWIWICMGPVVRSFWGDRELNDPICGQAVKAVVW